MKVETIHGKSLYITHIEADMRQALTNWQRKYRNREVKGVEFERLAKVKTAQFHNWKLIITYKEIHQ